MAQTLNLADMIISNDTLQKVQALLAQNQKVRAVKVVKDETNCSLKEAKDYIDQLGLQKVTPSFNGSVDDELRALLAAGRKLEAVKLYKEQSGLGLAASKDYVEKLELYKLPFSATSNTAIDQLLHQQQPPKKRNWLLILLIYMLISAILYFIFS
jgi:ribosomal protein L7/L12